MVDFKAFFDSPARYVVAFSKKLVYAVVASHDEALMLQLDGVALGFPSTGVLISPYLEEMGEAVRVHVINHDVLLTLIAIPPLVLRFAVVVWVLLPDSIRFTSPGHPPMPLSSDSGMGVVLQSHDLVHSISFDQLREFL